jgi:beta-lactamase regulating signal transducer with metallopeptidase domain
MGLLVHDRSAEGYLFRIRADREFACDSMALDCGIGSTPAQFGETMVKVLEIFSSSHRCSETISVVRDGAELKRRIHRIAAYRPMRQTPVVWSALFSLICLAGGAVVRVRRLLSPETVETFGIVLPLGISKGRDARRESP